MHAQAQVSFARQSQWCAARGALGIAGSKRTKKERMFATRVSGLRILGDCSACSPITTPHGAPPMWRCGRLPGLYTKCYKITKHLPFPLNKRANGCEKYPLPPCQDSHLFLHGTRGLARLMPKPRDRPNQVPPTTKIYQQQTQDYYGGEGHPHLQSPNAFHPGRTGATSVRPLYRMVAHTAGIIQGRNLIIQRPSANHPPTLPNKSSVPHKEPWNNALRERCCEVVMRDCTQTHGATHICVFPQWFKHSAYTLPLCLCTTNMSSFSEIKKHITAAMNAGSFTVPVFTGAPAWGSAAPSVAEPEAPADTMKAPDQQPLLPQAGIEMQHHGEKEPLSTGK